MFEVTFLHADEAPFYLLVPVEAVLADCEMAAAEEDHCGLLLAEKALGFRQIQLSIALKGRVPEPKRPLIPSV